MYLFWGCWAFWGQTFFLTNEGFEPEWSMESGCFVKRAGFLIQIGGNFLDFRRIMEIAVPDQFCSPLTGFGQPFFLRNFTGITYCNI